MASVESSTNEKSRAVVRCSTNGAFLDVRPETLQVRRTEILDAGGAVVRQQDFN